MRALKITGIVVGAIVALFVGSAVAVGLLDAVGIVDVDDEPGSSGGPHDKDGDREAQGDFVRVRRVIDGDTVVLTRFGKTRLIGVNTPEDGCYETEATRFTRRRLEGKRVSYELGVERKDRYGRTLAYLTRRDQMHNLTLLEKGYATALTIPPNDKYAPRFVAAERDAKRRAEGRWGVCERRRREARGRAEARRREAERERREAAAGRRAARRAARRADRRAERRADRRRNRRGSSARIPKNCSGVNGPIPTPPGDPTNLDGNDDGVACE